MSFKILPLFSSKYSTGTIKWFKMKYLSIIVLGISIFNVIFCMMEQPISQADLPQSCCGFPNFQNPQIIGSCRKRYQKPSMTPLSEGCANECFFNTTRIWQNKQLNRQAVVTAFTRFVPQQWKRLMTQSMVYCFGKYESIPPAKPNPLLRIGSIGNPDCNEGPYRFVQCITDQLIRHCPAQRFRATPLCQSRRKDINSLST